MDFLAPLWLPIVLSAVAVFLVSTVIHMLLPIHKSDYKSVPDEDRFLAAIQPFALKPGQYFLPTCPGSMQAWKDPAVRAKFERGPVGWLTIVPSGMHGFGKNLAQWFLFLLAVSALTGYLAYSTLKPGAAFGEVFRVTGVPTVLAYGIAQVDSSIWHGRNWCVSWKFVVGGIAYGLATAAVFALMWPKG